MADPEQPGRDEQPVGKGGGSDQPSTPGGRRRSVRPLRLRLQRAAREAQVRQDVVEKDYAISYVLAGLASQPVLAESLVFKGGTALKKVYFTDYRFSEDLDFSASDAPKQDDLEAAIRQAAGEAARLLEEQGPFSIQVERYTERKPHPGAQEAFVVRLRFPWHPGPLCRVKIEVTHDEPVLLSPVRQPVSHGYEEDLAAELLCYRLEEVVAEKLRTLLQTQRKLAARGWVRPRARDYYDLWRILGERGDELDQECLPDLLRRKCVHRQVSFTSLADFFAEELLAEAQATWDHSLGPFVRDLPPCDRVLVELRDLLPRFLPDLG